MKALGAVALALAVCTVAGVAVGEVLPITMHNAGETGQTTLFRADLTGLDIGTIGGVTIKDRNAKGGSSGVFSGFDLDFIIFDRDGDLATTNDQVLPLTNGSTFVTPGGVRKVLTTPYRPTEANPGTLFGLLGTGGIDHSVATLGSVDAEYLPGTDKLTVNSSDGWVSLGDGGRIDVGFPLLSINSTESMYLFIGDVGQRDEFSDATVEIQLFVGAGYVPVTAGGVCYLLPGQEANLDGTPPEGSPQVVSWKWDLNGDGKYDEGVGSVLGVSFDYFALSAGLPVGSHMIGLRTLDVLGNETDYTCTVNLLPDPATWCLLGVGLPLMLRRKRKA